MNIFQLAFYVAPNTYLIQEEKNRRNLLGEKKQCSSVFLDIKWLIQSNILINCVNERGTYGLNFPWNTYVLKNEEEKVLGKAHLGFYQMGNILKIVENAVLSQNAAIFTYPYWLYILKFVIYSPCIYFCSLFYALGACSILLPFFPFFNREHSPLVTEEHITVSIASCEIPVNWTSVEVSVWSLLG